MDNKVYALGFYMGNGAMLEVIYLPPKSSGLFEPRVPLQCLGGLRDPISFAIILTE